MEEFKNALNWIINLEIAQQTQKRKSSQK